MSRSPLSVAASACRPRSLAEALVWFDQLLDDRRRCLASNLTLAADAGELDDLDGTLEAALDEFDRAGAEAREQFQVVMRAAIRSTSPPRGNE